MMKKIFFAFVLLLSACGFKPMFSGQDTDIYVTPISGINGIDLRNSLNAEFGGQREPDAKYTLKVTLKTPITKYKALEPTGDATWQQIMLKADYVLSTNGKKIASGSESASESYSFVRYLVAANASYNNAVQNTIKVLAEKISTKVIAETYRYENNSNKNE